MASTSLAAAGLQHSPSNKTDSGERGVCIHGDTGNPCGGGQQDINRARFFISSKVQILEVCFALCHLAS